MLSLPAIELSDSHGHHWLAINDVSINRRQGNRVADLQYSVGSEEVGRVRCDGLVVATPAGSTGYNLANGGPVMAWGVEGFVVSFIAPHSLTARPLVVAPGDEVSVDNRSQEEPVEVIDRRPADVHAGAGREHASAVRRRSGDARAGARHVLLSAGCARSSVGWRRPRGPGTRVGAGIRPGASGRPDDLMLHELRVENLLLMERAELRLGPGLNVLTGETGAGKTLLAHALDLLLGGRARRGIVRPGADEAYVEGVFELPAAAARGRADPGDRRGARAGAPGLARRPHSRLRLRPRRDARPTCRSSAARCCRSTGSTSIAS